MRDKLMKNKNKCTQSETYILMEENYRKKEKRREREPGGNGSGAEGEMKDFGEGKRGKKED